MTKTRQVLPRLTAVAFAAVLMVAIPRAALAEDAEPLAAAPSITAQPTSVAVAGGGDASFTVAFTGEPEPTVQWERSDDDGATWQAIQRTTAATLAVTDVTADDSGAQLRAQLRNDAGTATSEPATLTVTAAESEDAPAAQTPADAEPDGLTAAEPGADASTQTEAPAGEAGDPAGEPTASEPAQTIAPRGRLSAAAPASAATLSPGTYTITANPYVAAIDAPIGVNVYIGDASFPPVNAQKQNATLVVSDDGSLQLTIDFNQEIFTLQNIEDGDGVRVLSLVRGGTLDWRGTEPAAGAPTDRITQATVALDDTSGEYSFSNSVEYPTLLRTEKTWTIHLAVDFDSVVRQVQGDFSQTYGDEATGVTATVSAEEGSPSIPKLQDAAFTASEITDGDAYEQAKTALGQAFSNTPAFRLYAVSLSSGGGEIVLDDTADAQLSIPTTVANPSLYRIGGASATEVNSTPADGAVAASVKSFGTFAVVDDDTATPWAGVKTLTAEDISGLSLTYRTTGYYESSSLGSNFETFDSLGVYNAFFGEQTEGALYDSAVSTIDALQAYTDADVEGVYELGFDRSYEGYSNATTKHSPFVQLGSTYQSSLSGTVPVSGRGSSVYWVSGTAGGGITTAQQFDVDISDGVASFDLITISDALTTELRTKLSSLWYAATGWRAAYDTTLGARVWTDTTPLAYIVVAREAPTRADKPTTATGLVYDGTTQTGVPAGDGYDLSVVPTATDAGDYVARATLQDGYVWSDGTTDPVVLTWSIAQAQLTARYPGETVAADAAPQLPVEITGFVAGETAADAKGFTAPTVAAPAPLVAGQSYELAPSGGSAANYAFVYRSGLLRVTAPAVVTLAPGTYRVTANLYVPAEENDILHLTAYMTNPKNPLVPESDPNYGIPTSPVAGNATLVVGPDGARTLLIDLPNPAFTLIGFGAASGATVLGVDRDGQTYGANTAGRITRVAIALDAGATSAVFADSHVYAAPLRMDKTWDLHLSVDLVGAVLVSGDTTPTVPGGDGRSTGGTGGGPGSGTGGTGATGAVGATGTNPATGVNATFKPGTYTVTANIWLSRTDTGLPLNPHLTSGVFPPMDPVQDNATLVVDGDGRGVVTVPILIQSRIMTVRSITGPGVRTSGSDAVTSVTINLGVLSSANAIVTRTLTASVSIGELAMSIGGPIFGGTTEHTWPATFQLNLSGVPTSGGGVVPAWALATLAQADAADADDAASQSALDAARQANEKSKAAANAGDADAAPAADDPTTLASVLAAASAVLLAAAVTTIALVRRNRKRAHA